MVIEAEGERWKMKERGVLEAYASGTAIARWAERELRRAKGARRLEAYRDAKGRITAKHLGELARRGDRLALRAFERGGYYLGIGIANLLNVLNPQKVVLGGGVLKTSPPVFWKAMLKSCKRRAWKEAFRAAEIKRSSLRSRTGDLGALALAFELPD
jgi:glucokinase